MDAGLLGAREPYDQDMTVIEEIIESIQNRLCELNEEIGALTAARDALDGRGSRAPTRRRRGATTGKTRTGPGNVASGPGPMHGAVEAAGPTSTASPSRPHSKVRKPARRSARANAGRSVEVELLLSDTGGLATSELADRVDADRDRVLTVLRELEMAWRVRRTGQRRSTRWHTITDEEGIQERAAELAARSKSAA